MKGKEKLQELNKNLQGLLGDLHNLGLTRGCRKTYYKAAYEKLDPFSDNRYENWLIVEDQRHQLVIDEFMLNYIEELKNKTCKYDKNHIDESFTLSNYQNFQAITGKQPQYSTVYENLILMSAFDHVAFDIYLLIYEVLFQLNKNNAIDLFEIINDALKLKKTRLSISFNVKNKLIYIVYNNQEYKIRNEVIKMEKNWIVGNTLKLDFEPDGIYANRSNFDKYERKEQHI